MKKNKILTIISLLIAGVSATSCSILVRALEIIDKYFPTQNTEEEKKTEKPTKIIAAETITLNLSSDFEKYVDASLDNGEKGSSLFAYLSSNENVVKVNENGLLTPQSAGSAQVTITYSKDGVELSKVITINVTSDKIADYTIMLYMCGSDLEHNSSSGGWGYGSGSSSDNALFTEDIKEILSVNNLPSSVNILIETGGTTKWHMPSTYLDGASEISSSSLQRWKVENKKLKLVSTLNTNYMAKESSFEDFLKWGLKDYPAQQMGVVISSHGAGVAGCVFDDNYTYTYERYEYQHCLRTFEIAEASKNALASSSRSKFTWIGYDCCLMQCADIASINADYFEYMVASQESESGTGWNHDAYLPYLVNNTKITPSEFLPKICDSFLDDNHSTRENEACLQTLSVLDLSKMNEFTTEFNSICSKIGTSSSAFRSVTSAFNASYNAFGEALYGLCDFKSFLNKLDDYFTSINVTTLLSTLEELVIYNKYCSKYTTIPCGVNAFVPTCSSREYSLQVGKEDYSNSLSTKFTTWQTLCVNNGDFGWDSI